MTYTTQEIKTAMIDGFKHSDTMIASTYSWAFKARAKVNAAIRALHKEGTIYPAYTSVAGNKVWKLV